MAVSHGAPLNGAAPEYSWTMSATASAFTQGEVLGWETPTTGTAAECIASLRLGSGGCWAVAGFAGHAQPGRSKMPQGEKGVNRAVRLPLFPLHPEFGHDTDRDTARGQQTWCGMVGDACNCYLGGFHAASRAPVVSSRLLFSCSIRSARRANSLSEKRPETPPSRGLFQTRFSLDYEFARTGY
jgi:hypothetical protein